MVFIVATKRMYETKKVLPYLKALFWIAFLLNVTSLDTAYVPFLLNTVVFVVATKRRYDKKKVLPYLKPLF